MIGTLRTVVLDAPDVRRLAAFYTALGGWTEQDADDEWIDRWRPGTGGAAAPSSAPAMYRRGGPIRRTRSRRTSTCACRTSTPGLGKAVGL